MNPYNAGVPQPMNPNPYQMQPSQAYPNGQIMQMQPMAAASNAPNERQQKRKEKSLAMQEQNTF